MKNESLRFKKRCVKCDKVESEDTTICSKCGSHVMKKEPNGSGVKTPKNLDKLNKNIVTM